MPQQIPVRPGLAKLRIALPAALPHGQRHSTVRMVLLDLPHDSAKHFIRKMRIFPALHHYRAQAEPVSFVRAGEDLLLREAVPLTIPVASADSAVDAVVFADVTDLQKAPDENLVSVDSLLFRHGSLREILRKFLIPADDQLFILFRGQPVLCNQPVRQLFHLFVHHSQTKKLFPIPRMRTWLPFVYFSAASSDAIKRIVVYLPPKSVFTSIFFS